MIGQMTISEVMPALNLIAKENSLKLYKVKDFQIARKLLAIRYSYFYGAFNQN